VLAEYPGEKSVRATEAMNTKAVAYHEADPGWLTSARKGAK
jgi:hypothetical protein